MFPCPPPPAYPARTPPQYFLKECGPVFRTNAADPKSGKFPTCGSNVDCSSLLRAYSSPTPLPSNVFARQGTPRHAQARRGTPRRGSDVHRQATPGRCAPCRSEVPLFRLPTKCTGSTAPGAGTSVCGTPQTHKPRAHQKPRGGRWTTHTREGPTRSRLPDPANVWPRRRCVYAPGRCDPHFGLGKREQTCHGSAIHEQKYVTGAPRTRHIALPQIPWVTLVTFGSLGTISCCNWRVRGGG